VRTRLIAKRETAVILPAVLLMASNVTYGLLAVAQRYDASGGPGRDHFDAAGFRIGGFRAVVPCLDRDAFDFVVVPRELFATAGATAADVAALGLLTPRAVSEGGALAGCGGADASEAAGGDMGCAVTASAGGAASSGCSGAELVAGGSAARFARGDTAWIRR